MEEGTNPRLLEREQLIRLMSLFADVFFVGRWDPELGGRRLEHSVQSGEKIPESHLLAWRIAREEVMANVLRWVRLVVANYNAYTGQVVKEDRLFQVKLTDALWERIRNFLVSLSKLPCWIDKNLANTGLLAQSRTLTTGRRCSRPANRHRTSRSLPLAST